MSSAERSEPPGPLLGHGRAADVYDIGDGLVLRRNRSGASTELEAAVMRHVHKHGYPVPGVHDADGADLIMDRIDGPTMLDEFSRRPWKVPRWAAIVADLHDRIGRIPKPDLELPAPFGSPEVIVHGDLHPDNVMLTTTGPIVIDWTNAGLGPSGLEVANTWLIMATSELDGGRLARVVQEAGRSWFIRQFRRRCDRGRAEVLLPLAARHRLGDRNLRPGEAVAIRRLVGDTTGG